MKRAQRLKMVQNVVEDLERRRAEQLALKERRVNESELRLTELETYQASYSREFNTRASSGIGAVGLRDYQTFLTRLAEAVRQQSQVVFRMRAERDAEHRIWQSAAQRAEAVGRIVKRWLTEERRTFDRFEQRESDERAQRITNGSLHARGI
jgi:flagellar FliJ protein